MPRWTWAIDEPRSQKLPSKSTVVEPDGACPIAVTMPSLTHYVDFDRVGTRSIRDHAAGKPYVSQRTSRALETTLLNTGEFYMRYRTQQW